MLALTLAACQAPTPVKPLPSPPEPPNAAGLVPLPCGGDAPVRPVSHGYCLTRHNYVTPAARAALLAAAAGVAEAYPGAVVRYMDASWPQGTRPMPPHLSHGDGREIDLAVFFVSADSRPLSGPPTLSGYNAFEPPRRKAERVCVRVKGPHQQPDPPASRAWRLDTARTADLVRRLTADRRVRRVFIEPHLKARLGFAHDPKVRFAGCQAARHDDHMHVDFR